MEKRIGSYETLIVINAALAEEEIKALVEKFTALASANGTVESVDEWGKRRLAYPINDMPEGYYTVVTFKAEPAFPAELERLYNIDENVMRDIVLKLDFEPVAKAAEAVEATEETVEEATETDAE